MATTQSINSTQRLHRAYYCWPTDQARLNFWATRPDVANRSLRCTQDSTRNAIATSDEFKALFRRCVTANLFLSKFIMQLSNGRSISDIDERVPLHACKLTQAARLQNLPLEIFSDAKGQDLPMLKTREITAAKSTISTPINFAQNQHTVSAVDRLDFEATGIKNVGTHDFTQLLTHHQSIGVAHAANCFIEMGRNGEPNASTTAIPTPAQTWSPVSQPGKGAPTIPSEIQKTVTPTARPNQRSTPSADCGANKRTRDRRAPLIKHGRQGKPTRRDE